MAIPYGEKHAEIRLDDSRVLGVLAARGVEPGAGDFLLAEAGAAPVEGPSLAGFAEPGEPVLVLVNDATRPTPTAAMIALLRERGVGWDLSYLVATGTHRAPNEEELQGIFGSAWPEVQSQVSIHDARDEAGLADLGRTSAGTRVKVNRHAAEAAKIIVLSSVETHYFAGYTGGRKIILPGIAAFESIEQNHRLALKAEACALRLEGNPVHRDMDEALGLLLDGRKMFALLAVLDREQRIYAATAGAIRPAFAAAAARVNEIYAVPVREKADIVVAAASAPLDIDFYQAQKLVENGRLILNDGGILIIVSACRTGTGNDAFLKLMAEAGSPAAVLKAANDRYRLGFHKAARLAEVASRAELWAVAGVADEVARTAFMRPFAGVQEALDAALEARPDGRVWFLMDAGVTVPRLVD